MVSFDAEMKVIQNAFSKTVKSMRQRPNSSKEYEELLDAKMMRIQKAFSKKIKSMSQRPNSSKDYEELLAAKERWIQGCAPEVANGFASSVSQRYDATDLLLVELEIDGASAVARNAVMVACPGVGQLLMVDKNYVSDFMHFVDELEEVGRARGNSEVRLSFQRSPMTTRMEEASRSRSHMTRRIEDLFFSRRFQKKPIPGCIALFHPVSSGTGTSSAARTFRNTRRSQDDGSCSAKLPQLNLCWNDDYEQDCY